MESIDFWYVLKRVAAIKCKKIKIRWYEVLTLRSRYTIFGNNFSNFTFIVSSIDCENFIANSRYFLGGKRILSPSTISNYFRNIKINFFSHARNNCSRDNSCFYVQELSWRSEIKKLQSCETVILIRYSEKGNGGIRRNYKQLARITKFDGGLSGFSELYHTTYTMALSHGKIYNIEV